MNEGRTKHRSLSGTELLCILILAAFELITFRRVLFGGWLIASGGDALNDADGLLAVLMNEHWVRVIRGLEPWDTWMSLYPAKGSVAFNDMYLMHALLYVPMRLLGMDRYAAFAGMVCGWHAIGTYIWYGMSRKVLRWEPLPALLGTTAFSFGSYYLVKIWHCQFLAMALVPVVIGSAYVFWMELTGDVKKRRIAGALWVCMMVLLFYTAPYLAEFVIIAHILYVVVSFLTSGKAGMAKALRRIGGYLKKYWWEILCYIALGILLMIPFCLLYLPRIGGSSRDYAETLYYCIPWRGVLRLPSSNLLYGRWMGDTGNGEWAVGIPILEWILLLACFVRAIRKKDGQGIALFLTTGLVYGTVLRVHGMSLWKVFYALIPGAASMRAVCRMALMAIPFAALLLGRTAQGMLQIASSEAGRTEMKQKGRNVAVLGILCVTLLVYAENAQSGGIACAWTRDTALAREERLLALAGTVPADCESFYCVESAAGAEMAEYPGFYRGCADAWLLADLIGVPTLNSFASFLPEGYGETYNIYTASYEGDVRNWIQTNDLRNVYRFDLSSGTWMKVGEQP
ncbi:MAG: hypothetical protein IKS07_06830 [Lachnospiraceae bacterium]|nr:hypothetical protein [Lachnospiraceae bacterium]